MTPKEEQVLRMKARLVDRLPFCPDHRDKVAGKPCRECLIETMRGALDKAPRELRHCARQLEDAGWHVAEGGSINVALTRGLAALKLADGEE